MSKSLRKKRQLQRELHIERMRTQLLREYHKLFVLKKVSLAVKMAIETKRQEVNQARYIAMAKYPRT